MRKSRRPGSSTCSTPDWAQIASHPQQIAKSHCWGGQRNPSRPVQARQGADGFHLRAQTCPVRPHVVGSASPTTTPWASRSGGSAERGALRRRRSGTAQPRPAANGTGKEARVADRTQPLNFACCDKSATNGFIHARNLRQPPPTAVLTDGSPTIQCIWCRPARRHISFAPIASS